MTVNVIFIISKIDCKIKILVIVSYTLVVI